MSRVARALAVTAAVFAAVDLVHKAAAAATSFHPRSAVYAGGVLLLAAVWVAAILATRSLSLAVAGGVVAGGAGGNLISLLLWPGVPNPLVVEPIAFNLADVFVVAGFLVTAGASLSFAVRNRERLGEPVRLR